MIEIIVYKTWCLLNKIDSRRWCVAVWTFSYMWTPTKNSHILFILFEASSKWMQLSDVYASRSIYFLLTIFFDITCTSNFRFTWASIKMYLTLRSTSYTYLTSLAKCCSSFVYIGLISLTSQWVICQFIWGPHFNLPN